jgi:cytochrome c553
MNRILIVVRGSALALSVTTLFPSSVAWSGQGADLDKLLAGADAQRGEALTEVCADCHGPKGYSKERKKPNLAGQVASYTLKQLLDYKSRARPDKTMSKEIKRLDQQDLADLAVYYAALPTNPGTGVCTNPPELITKGDPSRNIAACMACHGAQGQGSPPDNPALAGQKPDYIIEELKEFRSGVRKNDVGGVVRAMLKDITDAEIAAIAECYAEGSQ